MDGVGYCYLLSNILVFALMGGCRHDLIVREATFFCSHIDVLLAPQVGIEAVGCGPLCSVWSVFCSFYLISNLILVLLLNLVALFPMRVFEPASNYPKKKCGVVYYKI